MRFLLLGPLQVLTATNEIIDIGRPKHRQLLALLLLNTGRVVSTDRLVDGLWQGTPPESARANLKTYVWALRNKLPCPGGNGPSLIRTADDGYLLELPDDAVLDVAEFERLLAAGRVANSTGQAVRASELLDRALSLWRGAALQDLETGDELAAAAQRLEDLRLAAFEELIDAKLALGRHAEVIGDLRAWTARHPFQERLWAMLMLALYRDGRQADALDAYQRLRRRLVAELGVEPGHELCALHRAVLARDPALDLDGRGSGDGNTRYGDPPVPRQLPRDVPVFVGRTSELADLRARLSARGRETTLLVAISGPAGVGKSALALRAAHEAADAYPDGQLYVNLRGTTPGASPLPPLTALGRFLRALSVPPGKVPGDEDEAAALFRTLLSDRRTLVVLDDARDAAQIRPLLPGGPDCAVLVTSRVNLSHLPGAHTLRIGPLGPEEGMAVLDHAPGGTGSETDRAARLRLTELCGGLPLALTVAAARLAGNHGLTPADLAARLQDESERLSELAVGDVEVRRSLAVSYTVLAEGDDPVDRDAAAALPLLGMLRVWEFGPDVVTALTGWPIGRARRAVERLTDNNLVTVARGDRRTLHDLVRLFAREKAAEKAADHWHDALSRVLRYHVVAARHAFHLIDPHRDQWPLPEVGPVEPPPLATLAEGRAWLELELPNLVGVATQALSEPDPDGEHAVLGLALAGALHWYLKREGDPEDLVLLKRQAVEAARRLGDRVSEAACLDHLGCALGRVGRYDEACEHLREAVALYRELGDRRGQVKTLGNLGATYLGAVRPVEALPLVKEQFAIATATGWDAARTHAAIMLGSTYHLLGDPDSALEWLERAVAQARKADDVYYEISALNYLATVRLDRGERETARDLVKRARSLAVRNGDDYQRVCLLILAARIHRLAGETAEAVSTITKARAAAGALPGKLNVTWRKALAAASREILGR